MKKYYIHNGREQQGPFDIDELKTKNITKDTSVWYEGLSEWSTAEKIDELKDLLKTEAPPPFGVKPTPPPILEIQVPSATPVTTPKKKSNSGQTILIIVILFAVFIGGFVFFKSLNRSSGGESSGASTYQEKVMTVEEIERSQPTSFLTAGGKYNESFWGDKIKVHGVVKNSATVATYKDAIVRVTYYSKTKTVLGSEDHTIYEIFPPYSSKNFELKITNYKNVNSIGWDVISAKAY